MIADQPAESVRVEVRALDLYELVRHADRGNIALMGVQGFDAILRERASGGGSASE